MSFKPWLCLVALTAAVLASSSRTSQAAVITLSNQNSVATFHTQASDGGELGLNTWDVDGTDHMFQQWFWYRTGSQTQENAIDGTGALAHVSSTAIDLDGSAGDDYLQSDYADNETAITPEKFTVQLRYLLTGGAAGSDTSDIVEVIRVKNTGTSTMRFSLFQYVDFDLNQSIGDDTVLLSGTPINTATQSDPINIIGETVVTPPPTRFEANLFSVTRDKLNDAFLDNLNNNVGPFVGDTTWAFQWDMVIPAGGTVLISKDKQLRPGEGGIIPEPSTIVLAGIGLLGAFGWSRRRRAA